MLQQQRLCWLSHIHHVSDGRIPKGLMYGELVSGTRLLEHPHLQFKGICKHDLKLLDMDVDSWWEEIGSDMRSVDTGSSQRSSQSQRRTETETSHRAQGNITWRKKSPTEGLAGDTGYTCNHCAVCGLQGHAAQSRVNRYSASWKILHPNPEMQISMTMVCWDWPVTVTDAMPTAQATCHTMHYQSTPKSCLTVNIIALYQFPVTPTKYSLCPMTRLMVSVIEISLKPHLAIRFNYI